MADTKTRIQSHIKRLTDGGMPLTEIATAISLSESDVTVLSNGEESEHATDDVLASLIETKTPKKETPKPTKDLEMSEDLVLSELAVLAGRMNVEFEPSDTVKTISDRIAGIVPLELSEREQGFMRSNRESRIRLLGNRITPAVKNHIVLKYAKADLVLSESSEREFAAVMDVLSLLPEDGAKPKTESTTGVQTEELKLSELPKEPENGGKKKTEIHPLDAATNAMRESAKENTGYVVPTA